eukprot:354105-Chlamydomonas_euryale.AAC.1
MHPHKPARRRLAHARPTLLPSTPEAGLQHHVVHPDERDDGDGVKNSHGCGRDLSHGEACCRCKCSSRDLSRRGAEQR